MDWRRTISEGVRPIVDLVYPPRCPACGEATADQRGLCSNCWSDLVIPGEPSCSSCQRPFTGDAREVLSTAEDAVCAACMQSPPKHEGIAAGVLYNDTARKLVLSFKHGRRIALAPMLSGMIASHLPELEEDAVLVPVPLHRWRLWSRGFNQAALLATHLAERAEREHIPDALHRTRSTQALGGLSRKDRARELKGAIAVRPKHAADIKGKQIVLVDDVLTSGATSAACVSALKRVGARSVIIACFARVLDEVVRELGTNTNARSVNSGRRVTND